MYFSTFDFSVQLDVELIPLSLRLIGLVTLEIDLKFFSIKITLFSTDLYRYRSPSINKKVFHLNKEEEDVSPPDISSITNQVDMSPD